MCILVAKLNKDGKPHHAKLRIIILGNFEDRYYSKLWRYTPVLAYSLLHLIVAKAVSDHRILQ